MTKKVWHLIPALDTTNLDQAAALVRALHPIPFVYGYKVGFSLGLSHGLPSVVARLREFSHKPIIYDHQKAATDIPATGAIFARLMAKAGIDEVILFPQAGPKTERAWIQALHDHGRKVIVGGAMTHLAFLRSEGGFIADEAPAHIFSLAAGEGVRSFVVPLTKPEIALKALEEAQLDPAELEFYSPGYGIQGGDPCRFDFISHHYIIAGRSLLNASDPVSWVEALQESL